jgi:hypothetical protein
MHPTKKLIIIVGIIALTILIVYAVLGLRFYFAMEKSNKESAETKCNYDSKVNYKGVLYRIDRYEYNPDINEDFFGLNIYIMGDTSRSESNDIKYQYYLPDNKELIEFVNVNDSVVKKRADNFFTVISRTKGKRDFKLPTCK